MIHVVIPGVPYAQKRHRAAIGAGGHARAHDHKDNKSWKGAAQVHMIAAMAGRPPLECRVALTIVTWFPLPAGKHLKRSKRPADWADVAKDYDNLAKAPGDAGNGILWMDDRQIVTATIHKARCAQGDPPCMLLLVSEAPPFLVDFTPSPKDIET